MGSETLKKIKTFLPRVTVRRKWKLVKAAVWAVSCGTLVLTADLLWGINIRPVSETVNRAWALCFVVVFLTALVLPLFVRKLEVRLHPMPNLFRKQLILYTSVALFPAILLCLIFGAAAFAGQVKGIPWLPSLWLLAAFLLSILLLSAWAIFLAVKDMNQRIVDSLLVITNGMEMASNLDFDRPIIAPSLDEIGLVSEIFNQVAHLLKTRVNILQALFNNMRIFSGLLSEDKILKHTLKSFKSLEEASEIVVALWDEDGEDLVVKGSTQDKPGILDLRFGKGEGIFGRIIEEPQLLACPQEEYEILSSRSRKEAELWGKPGFVVGIPMIFQGRLKGAVALYNMKFDDYQMDVKRDYLQGLANQIAIFLENARLYGMVIRDRLTALYVHSFIEAEMENLIAQAKRYKFPVSFIMFDVDKFKQINDSTAIRRATRC